METLNMVIGSVMVLFGSSFLLSGISERKRNRNVFDQKNVEVHISVGFALFAIGGLVFLLSALRSA